MSAEPTRPDPDALLAGIQRERQRTRRGRLTIFFGMCPGVGKTYAMLQAARRRLPEGGEVLAGIVETHGRAETEALLAGMAVVPRTRSEYRGAALEELDLDAILLWKPALALIDELAHTNAPGSRHQKRHQDVLELLAAGIDVFTTLNVQHVESRRETVQQVTGVLVRETVPDSLLDLADELILVDLTPEQLRERLADGKVYHGVSAATAADHFFRESNLLALRELALRLVAEHVDHHLRGIMMQERIAGPWKTGDRLLAAVSASPFSERLIRYTRRLASTMEAPWLVASIELPRTMPPAEQEQLNRHLALARQLGAEVISAPGAEVGESILRVARQHHVTQIVMGKPLAGSPFSALWRRPSPVEYLLRHSGEIDLCLIRSDQAGETPRHAFGLQGQRSPLHEYAEAVGGAAALTVVGLLLLPAVGYWAVALLYLLGVFAGALRLGRRPILLLATISALLWDFLFIPPRYTLLIAAPHDWMMFGLYFVVAIVCGHLTTRLRQRELAERRAEERSTALYQLTRALVASASLEEAVAAVVRQARASVGASAAVLLRAETGIAPHPASTLPLSAKEESVANWAYQRQQSAGRFTKTLPNAEAMHFPLLAREQCEGVLAVALTAAPTLRQLDLLETFAGQLAAFAEKERALQAMRAAQVNAQSQQLQKALFDSVSHELKTPLAAIAGALEQPAPNRAEMQLAVQRLTRTVDHLLDATRLESGLLQPRREWCDPAELARESAALAGLPATRLALTADAALPPISVDPGLLAQALCILLANAALYSPADSPLELHTAHDGGAVLFSVLDRGPGIPAGEEERLFEKFYRGGKPRPGGIGLGLSIARRLVELHGGTLRAHNRPGGGAIFTIRLPLGAPMRLPAAATA